MKRLTKLLVMMAVPLLSAITLAAEMPFDQAKFAAVLAAGTPAAVAFHADWCPTCRTQAPLLKGLMQTPELKNVTLFVANFDTEAELKKSLGVTKQSTVVVFKAGKESARSTGDTQRESLAGLLRHAIT